MNIVAEFRIDKIDELCRQLAFTPQEARLAQLSATEELLFDIDPAKAYPLNFIVFRITGYHPKLLDQALLTGLALQHDLGLLIEQVSSTLDLHVEAVGQPVLTIDEVTERFNVASKTIQRWRRRGLSARLLIFPDGKRRVAFLLGVVERFLAQHRDQVVGAANFSQVSDEEKSEILRRAARLAQHCRCCGSEISRRIGRRLHRSPLTIAHVIRAHDQANPQSAILNKAPVPISDEDRAEMLRAVRRGVSISAIAHRTCRPRSAVYRAIIEERLSRLNRRKIRFIDDPLYHQGDAATVINQIVSQQDIMDQVPAEERRIPRDLPPYLQDLYRTPLLSRAGERALFLKLNFQKFQFVTARRNLDPELARARDLNRLEALRRNVAETKNQIVRANLRLVVSVARKHLRPSLSLMELLSEGNLTLMRAVDSFDIHKGNRFSTYATLALMKGFARSVPQMLSGQFGGRKSAQSDSTLAAIPDRSQLLANDRMLHRDEVSQLLSRLESRERDVILAHYGLTESGPATYEQVGARLGLSKQRVRQIEQTALAKLRAAK